MNVQWLKDRVINGLIYCVVILAVGLALYKLFIAKTNQTTYTAPSFHALDDAKFAPFSCARIVTEKIK